MKTGIASALLAAVVLIGGMYSLASAIRNTQEERRTRHAESVNRGLGVTYDFCMAYRHWQRAVVELKRADLASAIGHKPINDECTEKGW
jgi:predicted nucleic acid-binding Zn ribbon protein